MYPAEIDIDNHKTISILYKLDDRLHKVGVL